MAIVAIKRGRGLNKEAIRIGLLLNRSGQRPWQCRLAEEIAQDDRFVLSQVLRIADGLADSHINQSTAWQSKMASKLLGLIEAAERGIFVPTNLSEGAKTCQALSQAQATELAFNTSLDASAISAISRLDIIISLVPISKQVAHGLASHASLWAIAAGDGEDISDPHFGFWDMFNNNGISRLALLEVSADGTALLAEGNLRKQFCYALNKCFLLEKSVALILRELRRWVWDANTGRAAPLPYIRPSRKSLKTSSVFAYLLRLAANLAPKIYKMVLKKTGRRYNQWSLFVGSGKFAAQHMSKACETHPPANEFWADPFLFRPDGSSQVHVFFENYEFAKRRGKISVGGLHNNKVEYIGDALVGQNHLSYPFVFSYDGEIYMVPESGENRQIEIWKAIDYPLGWVLHKAVMQSQSCADTTIFEHKGDWWMFTNISNDPFEDHCSELHIFKVDSPMLNEIEPHALNPVIMDARTARNAGRITVRDGKLTRLAQNNAYHYGYGFSLMEIEKLSLQEYGERCLYSVEPGFVRGITSTHHLDHLDGVYIFDGLREFG